MNVTPLVDTRGAGTSSVAKPGRFRHPSLSHVLIALAVVLAFTFNFLALQDRERTVLVAVANAPLDAGSSLDSADVRFVTIDAGFEGMASLVEQDAWTSVSGWVLTRPVPEGGVITVDGLTRPLGGDGLRSMSVPVAREHAAGGLLEIGDVVDVISVGAAGPGFVVTGVEVVGVASESGGIGSVGGYFVVIAVDPAQALDLAGAIDSGSLEVIRSSGAVPVEGRNGA
ncbi:MAG: SAF domain-containing protein [Acidimicrobiia bacterium]